MLQSLFSFHSHLSTLLNYYTDRQTEIYVYISVFNTQYSLHSFFFLLKRDHGLDIAFDSSPGYKEEH